MPSAEEVVAKKDSEIWAAGSPGPALARLWASEGAGGAGEGEGLNPVGVAPSASAGVGRKRVREHQYEWKHSG